MAVTGINSSEIREATERYRVALHWYKDGIKSLREASDLLHDWAPPGFFIIERKGHHEIWQYHSEHDRPDCWTIQCVDYHGEVKDGSGD